MSTLYQTRLGNCDISYHVIRSRRKTIKLAVKHTGLELTVPLLCTHQAIQQALVKHTQWILTQLAQRPPHPTLPPQTTFWLGKPLPVIIDAPHSRITEEACYLAINNNSDLVLPTLHALYQYMALPYLQKRTYYWAGIMHLMPTRILLSHAKRSWGSCNQRREIRLSWRLLQVSTACIDYVIIHELAHLHEMNHSKRFWQVVAHYCPDYKQKIADINHQARLNFL